ncbi:tetratricopeptide repeat protein [bacterium]|nr:tetratricopeptide repeat protein [bacterium]
MLKEYPKSYRAPFAQYQIGECYEELGEGKLAHKSFKKVLRKYPATRPARWVRWR